MESKPASSPPTAGRKRGYRTFDKVIEERSSEIIDLDGDTKSSVKRRKRTITVLDLTQEDDDDDNDDEVLFSPSQKRRDRPSTQHEYRGSTCMSCAETKAPHAFHEGKIAGGSICNRCWEASFSAELTIEAHKEKECSICYDSAPAYRFPVSPHGGTREGSHSVCIACWERHLHSEIERKAWDKLTCPQDGCGQVLQYGEIEVLGRTFERAIEPIIAAKATATYLSSEETFFACPSGTCKSGSLIDAGHDQGTFSCEACGYLFCFACKVPMHTGKSCVDYQDSINGNKERAKQEAASKKLVESTYKTCPNRKCGSKLELMSGCDHVICLHCKRKFNWSSVKDPRTIRPPARVYPSEGMGQILGETEP